MVNMMVSAHNSFTHPVERDRTRYIVPSSGRNARIRPIIILNTVCYCIRVLVGFIMRLTRPPVPVEVGTYNYYNTFTRMLFHSKYFVF